MSEVSPQLSANSPLPWSSRRRHSAKHSRSSGRSSSPAHAVRWPWTREPDGEQARAAQAAAERQLARAEQQRSRVDETVQAASQLVRRVEQSAEGFDDLAERLRRALTRRPA